VALVAGLDFGPHKRPSRVQAAELARLVEAASTDHELPENEIRRYCRAALNEAKRSGVSYLRGALNPDRLPVPMKSETNTAATDSGVSKDFAKPDLFDEVGRDFMPSRFKAAPNAPQGDAEPSGVQRRKAG
jgi:hypothetical protein